ncbi:MAG: hypothetical protein O3C09_05220 [Proteobacteria bacterium]|nr:hypothetical protein [Pseudomonadota bacterium]
MRRWPVLLAAVALAACAPSANLQPPAPTVALPTPLATSQSNMPIDAIRVAAAIVDRLQGGTGMASGVSFLPAAGQRLDGGDRPPDGFNWRGTTLLQYAARTPGDGRRAAGRLEFGDGSGRRTALLFTVEYVTAAEPIEVVDVRVAVEFGLSPAVAAYVIDAADLPAAGSDVLRSHGGLLALAAAKGRPAADAGDGDQVVLVFLMEQSSPSAAFAAGVSVNRFGTGMFADDTRYVDDGGFRAALIPGGIREGQVEVFAKALFRPGAELDEALRRPRLIGSFSVNPPPGG